MPKLSTRTFSNNPATIEKLESEFKEFLAQQSQGDAAHDVMHISRVVKSAKAICLKENGDINIVGPAAWLHDCYAVAKNHADRSRASQLSADKAVAYLQSIHYDAQYLEAIHHAIVAHSFSANIEAKTLEAKIVQDADRLDALGAVGISRLMQVSGSFASALYHPEDPFCKNREADDKAYAVDHFYKKLFQLDALLHTNAAKAEAKKRNAFMHAFLQQMADEIV